MDIKKLLAKGHIKHENFKATVNKREDLIREEAYMQPHLSQLMTLFPEEGSNTNLKVAKKPLDAFVKLFRNEFEEN